MRKKSVKESKKTSKTITKSRIIYSAVILLLVIFGSFYFIRYNQVNEKYKDAVMTQDQKNQKTINKVAKLMDLPKDETPTIFAVKDKDKLGTSSITKQYFDKTKNDDVILAYQKANISIIYRPSENRIIKTDNYNNFIAAANPIKLAIIANQEVQDITEKNITSKVLNVEIVSKQIPKTAVMQSVVVDLTGQNAKAAKELADKIGATVGQLPEGEQKPEGAMMAVIIQNTTSAPAQ